jgi:dCMP deaminase
LQTEFLVSSEYYQSKVKWDKRFLGLCVHLSAWSEERGRRVGSVIVGDGNVILSTGYNGLPRRVSALPDNRHDRAAGEKYLWFEHAERNAIYNAARIGVPLAGARIYSNLFPCADCTRAIIQSGIVELICYQPPEGDANFGRSMSVAMQLLEETGVKVTLY